MDVNGIDTTLCYLLFRHVTGLPNGTWGPKAPTGSLQEKVERLRELRNTTGFHGSLPVTQTEFTRRWNILKAAIKDLGGDDAVMDNLKTIAIDNQMRQKLDASEKRVRDLLGALENTHYDVPQMIPNFTGRDHEINEIRQLFKEKNKDVVVLN